MTSRQKVEELFIINGRKEAQEAQTKLRQVVSLLRPLRLFAAITPCSLCLCGSILLLFCSCSSSPTVRDVWVKQRLQVVSAAEEDLFLHDRATMLHTEGKFLPHDQQGELYQVDWQGRGIDHVKFEYHQAKRPDAVQAQTFQPGAGKSSTTFAVVGDDYSQGGPVSAWRVTLWRSGELLAEKKSVLW